MEALQASELQKIIDHAVRHVPYYRDLAKGGSDLQSFPILEKATVQQYADELVAENYAHAAAEVVNTSGSTGRTLRIRVVLEGRRTNYAFFARFKSWAGVDAFARSATFGGRSLVPPEQQKPPYWRYNLANNNLLFSSFHLSPDTARHYAKKLREWKPIYIESYPSSIYSLALFALEQKLDLPRPKAIFTSSETLFDEHRQLIEKAFGCQVFDQYGSAEQVVFAAQCRFRSYHLNSDFGHTELVPDGNGDFQIIATGFTNYAMPFIRYRTGDLTAGFADGNCECGLPFPVLKNIQGRVDDVVITPSGRRIGRLDPIFKGNDSIKKAQIRQVDAANLCVRLAVNGSFTPAVERTLDEELRKRLGNELAVRFEYVEDIPPEKNGKFRSVVRDF
jgi:phenylacetate-CoA ligase